ncbi:hypothetical protein D3C72_2025430 [compost metagenome]
MIGQVSDIPYAPRTSTFMAKALRARPADNAEPPTSTCQPDRSTCDASAASSTMANKVGTQWE